MVSNTGKTLEKENRQKVHFQLLTEGGAEVTQTISAVKTTPSGVTAQHTTPTRSQQVTPGSQTVTHEGTRDPRRRPVTHQKVTHDPWN